MPVLAMLASRILPLLSVVLVTACGGGSGGSNEPPPAPTLTLAAVPVTVTEGDDTTLTWSSTDATACTASGGWNGSRATSGSETVANLTLTATFTLTCRGAGGQVSRSATVIVEPAPNSPPVVSSFRSSDASVDLGDAINFSWTSTDVDGDTLRCALDVTGAGPEIVLEDCAGTVSQPYTYPEPGTYVPLLSVSDAETTVTARITQTVNDGFRIAMIKPRADARVDEEVPVRVTLQSPVEVSTVRATVEDRVTDLLPGAAPPEFAGTLTLTGLSRGEKILEVVAEDVNGKQSRFVRRIIYDQRPDLSVDEPLADSVATTTIRVAARCSDDDPAGCTLRVVPNADRLQPVLLSGQGTIDADVDLSAYDSQAVPLRVDAVDTAGQVTSVIRRVYVDGSDRLERMLDAPGTVLDVAGQRALHLVPGDAGDGLGVRDFVAGTAEVLLVPGGKKVNQQEGFLTPTGAIFVTTDVGGNVLSARVYQNDSTAVVDLGKIDSALSLTVAGRYAIYNRSTELLLRDLVAGVTATAASNAGNWNNSVAGDGTVALWNRGYQIELLRNGASTVLTNDATLWNVYPLTDGQRVLYRKQDPCCGDQTYALVLHDGIGEVTVRSANLDEASPGRGYQIVPDWVAYTDLGNLGQRHVWLYGPTGEHVQLTFLGTSSAIDRLAPDGSVMFTNQEGRQLGHPDGTTERIGAANGESFWIESTWYVAIGRSLFRVIP